MKSTKDALGLFETAADYSKPTNNVKPFIRFCTSLSMGRMELEIYGASIVVSDGRD